jgi:hypothetical protein
MKTFNCQGFSGITTAISQLFHGQAASKTPENPNFLPTAWQNPPQSLEDSNLLSPLFCQHCFNTLDNCGRCCDCLWQDGGQTSEWMRTNAFQYVFLIGGRNA